MSELSSGKWGVEAQTETEIIPWDLQYSHKTSFLNILSANSLKSITNIREKKLHAQHEPDSILPRNVWRKSVSSSSTVSSKHTT